MKTTHACVFIHHATAEQIQEATRAAALCADHAKMKLEERNGGIAVMFQMAVGKSWDSLRNILTGGPLDILKFVASKNIMVVGQPHYHA